MRERPEPVQSTEGGGVLYMALELSATRWHLASGVGVATPVRRKTIEAGDRAALQREVAQARARFGLAIEATVRSCYEAGRDGCWVHRWLAAAGVTDVVVDSSSIEVSRRARRAKTDRLDAEKLFRLLCGYGGASGRCGAWSMCRARRWRTHDRRSDGSARRCRRARGGGIGSRGSWRRAACDGHWMPGSCRGWRRCGTERGPRCRPNWSGRSRHVGRIWSTCRTVAGGTADPAADSAGRPPGARGPRAPYARGHGGAGAATEGDGRGVTVAC